MLAAIGVSARRLVAIMFGEAMILGVLGAAPTGSMLRGEYGAPSLTGFVQLQAAIAHARDASVPVRNACMAAAPSATNER